MTCDIAFLHPLLVRVAVDSSSIVVNVGNVNKGVPTAGGRSIFTLNYAILVYVKHLDILILANLAGGQPVHGYRLKQLVEWELGESISLNDNVLYPTLRRFEGMGAIEGELVPQDSRPSRRVFRITARGLALLQELLADFPPQQAADEVAFHARVTFLHLLAPQTRQQILAARTEALTARLARLTEMLGAIDQAPEWRYGAALLGFMKDGVERELAWIDELAARIKTEAAEER